MFCPVTFYRTLVKLNKEIQLSGFKLSEERIIEICNPFIQELKPKSALKIINKFEEYINQNPENISDEIKACVNFFKGTCYEGLGNSDDSYEYFIKAYKLKPSNIFYLEKACVLYFLQKQDKYIELLTQLEFLDEFNPRLWAVKTLKSENIVTFIKTEVPNSVLNKITYKRIVYNYIINGKDNDIQKEVNSLDISKIISSVPDSITYDKLYDWILILNYLLNKMLTTKPIIRFFDFLDNNEETNYLYKLSRKLSELINKSELSIDNFIHFVFYWFESELELKPNTIDNLENAYEKISVKNALHVTLLANAIQKQGDKEKAMRIINNFQGIISEQLLTLKTFMSLSNPQESNIAEDIIFFLETEKKITKNNFQNYANFIVQIIYSNSIKKAELIGYVNKADFLNQYYHRLIIYIIESHFKSEEKLALDDINKLKSNLINEPELNYLIASLYFENVYYKDCINFIDSYIDENIFTPSLLLQIEALQASTEADKVKLMRLLKKWRENDYPFNIQFLLYEINYQQIIQEWSEVIKIADYVLNQDPNNSYFYTCLLIALEQSEASARLEIELKKVNDFKFRKTEWSLRIAGILMRYEYKKEAIDLIYNEAINENNNEARLCYFNLQLSDFHEFFELYETVEAGRYVTYESNEKKETVFLEGSNLELQIVKKTLGKNLNDTVMIESNFNGRLELFKITRITNKYLALLDEIRIKAETSISNPLIQAFRIDEKDIESINKTFIENFAGQEEAHRKKAKQNLSGYNDYKMPFFALTSSNFSESFINAYNFLIYENGFLVKPLQYVNSDVSIKNKKLVIDFSSGLLLYMIAKKFSIEYSDKFIVSKNFYNFIDKEIIEIRANGDSKMTLSIHHDKVIPNILPDDYHENRLKYLLEIKEWFKENTNSEIPEEKLNSISSLYEKGQITPALDFFADNIFLALREDYILVTDDLMYNDKVPSIKNITTEKYLIEKFSEDKNNLLEYMLQLKYVGITLNADIIYTAYINQNKEGQKHIYNYCLRNISLKENFKSSNINIVLKFLKKLALNPILTIDVYKQTAINMFLMLINSLSDLEFVYSVKPEIAKEFNLLFDYQYITLEAFVIALDIRNKKG